MIHPNANAEGDEEFFLPYFKKYTKEEELDEEY